MTEDQERSSGIKLPIRRIVLVAVLIALAIFYLVETLGTTAELESIGPMATLV